MHQLEHLNLVVSDIDAEIAFYQAAFPHWRIRDEGTSLWSGKSRRWLHLGDDFQYLTLNDNGVGSNRDLAGHQIGLAHFAFSTANLESVMAGLSKAGFQPSKEGATEPYRKNVYYMDPAGFEVEFVEYLSDVPAERNLSS
ncbi:MAG: VOC family protein [Pseudomonadota bacterium]